MSREIINIFTSGNNIQYLKDYIISNIANSEARILVLENLTENVYSFPSNELLDNSQSRVRHSVNTWDEVRILNKKFIDDVISFCNEYPKIGIEDYANQMFIGDSLKPKGYEHLNNPQVGVYEEDDSRIFRYQDPNDINRSIIPRQQVISRGSVDRTNIDELRDSTISQIRSSSNKINIDNINTIELDCTKPYWIDN
jgi:hypothetical protein